MSDHTPNLEKALATERRNARDWEARAKANRREADELRGRAARLADEAKRSRRRIASLEGELAQLIAKAPQQVPTVDERREAILALAAMAGETVEMSRPGRILEGPDGPVGMTANVVSAGTIGGISITRAEAREHRIPEGTPGVNIYDTEATR